MSAALVLFLFHCFYRFLGIIRNLKATTVESTIQAPPLRQTNCRHLSHVARVQYGGYYYGRCRPCDRRPIRILELFKGQILIAPTGSLL
ncbi:hypothetical protein B0H13DRAFT_2087589, partial [Mycena leptocephala]